jgi:tripartite-type tricarboxylate transporter receptor subunit TctC
MHRSAPLFLRRRAWLALGACALASPWAAAQDATARPLRLVVVGPAGGSADRRAARA